MPPSTDAARRKTSRSRYHPDGQSCGTDCTPRSQSIGKSNLTRYRHIYIFITYILLYILYAIACIYTSRRVQVALVCYLACWLLVAIVSDLRQSVGVSVSGIVLAHVVERIVGCDDDVLRVSKFVKVLRPEDICDLWDLVSAYQFGI